MKNRKVFFVSIVILLTLALPVFAAAPANVILFIGDGMGFEQVEAASIYASGQPGTLSFESFPCKSAITTYSADSNVTDSAAAATAIATGHKVNNGVVSMEIPGDGSELQTLLEYFKSAGKSTAIVTTTHITHATPACFAAHEPKRGNYEQIGMDILTQTRPDVILGGGGKGMESDAAVAAGYTVVKDRDSLAAVNTKNVTKLCGLFGTGNMPYEFNGLGELPHLSEMIAAALKIIEKDPDGFFIMVEGGRIDHAGHKNDLQRNVLETIEFARAVQVAFDWAKDRSDTVIIVTADHETGDLEVEKSNGAGKLPAVVWGKGGHTAANVPLYAWGVNAHMAPQIKDNTQIFAWTTSVTVVPVRPLKPVPVPVGVGAN
ncbi:MAG: alkaline phosphatase [Planctomycetota bacterium]|jgi:alkaline phosphatase